MIRISSKPQRRKHHWFLLGFLATLFAIGLGSCSNSTPTPSVGQWVGFGGNEPTVTNGSFAFPGPGHIAGYFYTQLSSVPQIGQTLTLNYSVTADNPVWVQQPASGGNSETDINPPTLHLFLWRKGDDLSCAGAFNWYRQFSARTPLVVGDNQVISMKLDPTLWYGCYGPGDAAAFQGLLSNLLGAGFVFGGQWFAGHGVYLSSGSATFKINSFTVQ
jgi:hypothetical protein